MDGFNYIVNRENKKQKLTIVPDEYARDPRDEFENLTKIYTWHRHYRIGDEVPDGLSANELLIKMCKERNLTDLSCNNLELIDKLQKCDDIVIKLISLYDHSSISISTLINSYPYNDRWDSSLIGFVYVDKETILKYTTSEEGDWIEKATEIIDAEIQTLNDYMSGKTFGYKLYDPVEETIIVKSLDGKIIKNETVKTWMLVDSCFGFYGDADTVQDLKDIGILDVIGVYDSIQPI